jgi:NADPH-dependent 2,4-dienoyl-CoA reductase/sulfur reductase-like enzyme
MNLIKSMMGRRRFMMAAGVASTGALTCKKLTGFQTSVAMAAEQAATARVKAAGNRCPHLLSPLKIRNVMLKNRIMHTVAPNYLMQGPENYPSEAWRSHYSNMAKNAAIVSISTSFGKYPKTYPSKDDISSYSWSRISNDKWEDIPPVHNYVDRMVEDIHCEGSLVFFGGDTGSGSGGGGVPSGRGVPGGVQQGGAAGAQGGMPGGAAGGRGGMPGGSMPVQAQASKSVEDIVKEAKEYEANGYDVYEMSTPSLEAAQAVRSATNLIIMGHLRVSGRRGAGSAGASGTGSTNKPTGAEIEQFVESVRKLEGLVDFVRIGGSTYGNWTCERDELLPGYYYAEAIKKAGLKILTCMTGGLYDPIKNDEYIAKGITDMVGMTRPLFADQDLVKKVAAGRADDVIPCIQCQNCHGISMTTGPYYATCDVNPKWIAPPYKLAAIQTPLIKKKVAVIGGGPAGMKAALVAAERGHKVTLYEKDASLGGLQKYTEYTTWNWTYKVFKDWLINQVRKAGVEVRLNTTATPSMIKAEGYDTVLVATGAEPVISKMPSANADNVFNILTCYSNKKTLGKNVVMIGAGKFGVEAAVSMVQDGHKVTVLTSSRELVEPENVGAHNMQNQQAIYQNNPDFTSVLQATVKSITGGKVTYTDSKGAENSVQADSIVIYSGLKPRIDEAEKFIGSAAEVLPLGDCTGKNGTLRKTIRNAFYVASQV